MEYGIVDCGEDPNGSGLFGLDNTAGKDVGNERFDDVIGGFNADTRAQGYAAYGGIRVGALNLSPTLSDSPLVRRASTMSLRSSSCSVGSPRRPARWRAMKGGAQR